MIGFHLQEAWLSKKRPQGTIEEPYFPCYGCRLLRNVHIFLTACYWLDIKFDIAAGTHNGNTVKRFLSVTERVMKEACGGKKSGW